MFGGATLEQWLDETWIWDGENWRLATPTSHPSAREKIAMAYDESRDRVVLFGGANSDALFDDTWEWDGSNWELKEPDISPPGRCCHSMAYDSVTDRVIVYGGYNHLDDSFYDDTWAWDGSDWMELTCCDTPEMSGHALVSFSERNEVISIMTGGWGTWAWDGRSWSNLEIESPPHRSEGRTAYDGNLNRAIYFGGSKDGVALNDTWIFEGTGWQEIRLDNTPSPRFGHSIFYDADRQAFILFGGYANNRYVAETWELKLLNDISFLLTTPAPEPDQ